MPGSTSGIPALMHFTITAELLLLVNDNTGYVILYSSFPTQFPRLTTVTTMPGSR